MGDERRCRTNPDRPRILFLLANPMAIPHHDPAPCNIAAGLGREGFCLGGNLVPLGGSERVKREPVTVQLLIALQL